MREQMTRRESGKFRLGLNAGMFKMAGFDQVSENFPVDEETLIEIVCSGWRCFTDPNPAIADNLLNSIFYAWLEQAVDDAEDETEEQSYRRLYAVMQEYSPLLNQLAWAIYEQLRRYIQPFLDREGADRDCVIVFETLQKDSVVVSFYNHN